MRIAQLCLLIYNANTGKNAPQRTVLDFMPFAEKPKPSPREAMASFKSAVKRHLKKKRPQEH